MARPKKYRTKAEQKEANRAKNRRYYSRKKDEINRRRREKHAKKVARLARKELRPWAGLGEGRSRNSRASPQKDDTVLRAVAAARVIFATYSRVVGDNPSGYCHRLCGQLFKDFEKGVSIAEARNTAAYHTQRFSTFTKQVGIHYDTILNRAGIGSEFKAVEKMMKEIGDTVKMVEDIEACLIEGFEDLILSFKNKKLAFQQ